MADPGRSVEPVRPGEPVVPVLPSLPVLPGRFAAAVFDLDGLLVDTEPLWIQAEHALLTAHGGADEPGDAEATHGRSIDETVRIYAERVGLADQQRRLRDELIDRARSAFQTDATAMPGAAAVVRGLAGSIPVAVASNSDRELVDIALARAGLADAFVVVVTAEDVAHPKPEPDVYLEACRRLEVSPGDAIAFEDSPAGVEAALAAGLTTIGVLGHRRRSETPAVGSSAAAAESLERADHVVDSLIVVRDWIATPSGP